MTANLDLVRSIYADWERGDFGRADWAHPEIEYVRVDGPDPASWTGLAAVAEGWRGRLSPWEGYRMSADESRALDDERVLVLDRRTGRGKRSGLEIEQLETQGAMVFHFRDRKVTRLVAYRDRGRALADLGLEE